MTDSRKKYIVAGTAAVVLVGAAAAMPAINGSLLESRIQQQLPELAEKYDLSVQSLEIDRQFGQSSIQFTLQGEGLRKLNQQTLAVSGTLQHASVFSLPEMFSADLTFGFSTVEQGVRLTMPGQLQGSMGWSGAVEAELSTEVLELPLDPAGNMTVKLGESSALLSTVVTDFGTALELDYSSSRIDFLQHNQDWFSFTLEPSRMTVNLEDQSWNLAIPSVAYILPELSNEPSMIIDDVLFDGTTDKEEGLLSSEFSLTSGVVTVPALASLKLDQIVQGLTLRSSVENMDVAALNRLPEFLEQDAGSEPVSEEQAQQWLKDILSPQPRMALEELTIKTTKGDLTVAWDLEGTDSTVDFLQLMIDNPPVTAAEEQFMMSQAISAVDSSASLHLSDDLIDWSCEFLPKTYVEMNGGRPVEARIYSGMCKAMAESGEFINTYCLQFPTGVQQQCLSNLAGAQSTWVQDKTLTLSLEGGEILLNGAQLEQPVL